MSPLCVKLISMPQPLRRLILASTSPYRKKLLAQLGIPFETLSPLLDETPFKTLGLAPEQLSQVLAEEKAKAIHADADSVVIGSDQVAVFRGKILSKPKTGPIAVEQLKSLSGQVHELYTAVSVLSREGTWSHINKAALHMRELTEQDIVDYVSQDNPLDCAGSYKIEAAGIRLFSAVTCSDWTGIQGLPLIQLTNRLRALKLL
jgi:septum formation protein